jgi:K+-sensing histidine kinase KdpD
LNNEFNFSIHTDELLFERVIKNLIENALKYSLDKKLKIKICSDKIIFENNIHATLGQYQIEKIFTKFYS